MSGSLSLQLVGRTNGQINNEINADSIFFLRSNQITSIQVIVTGGSGLFNYTWFLPNQTTVTGIDTLTYVPPISSNQNGLVVMVVTDLVTMQLAMTLYSVIFFPTLTLEL